MLQEKFFDDFVFGEVNILLQHSKMEVKKEKTLGIPQYNMDGMRE